MEQLVVSTSNAHVSESQSVFFFSNILADYAGNQGSTRRWKEKNASAWAVAWLDFRDTAVSVRIPARLRLCVKLQMSDYSTFCSLQVNMKH